MDPKASIRIALDVDGLKQELRNLNDTFTSSMTELSSTFDLFSNVAETVSGAIGAVAEQLAEWVSAAAEVDEIERRAHATLITTGRLREDELDNLKALNSERQRLLGIDGDEQLRLQTRLAQMGVHAARLDEATRATIGLADATGQDLSNAATIVGKVFEGNITALKRMGIEVDSQTEAHQRFAEMYRVATAQAGSLTTETNALTEAYGDLKEALGGVILRAGEGGGPIGIITSALERMTAFVSGPYFGGAIVRLVQFAESISPFRGILGILGQGAAFATSLDTGINFGAVGDVLAPGAYNPAFDFAADQNDAANASAASARPDSVGRRGKAKKAPKFVPKQATTSNTRNLPARFGGFGISDFDQLRSGPLREVGANPFLDAATEAEGPSTLLAAEAERIQQMDSLLQGVAETSAGAVGSALGSIAAAIGSGADNIGEEMGRFVGQLVTQLGMMLIQVGTAALVLGGLSLIPGLQFIAGPPGVGIAAGGAALAAGLVMVGVGAAMGGGGGGAGASAPAAGGRAGGRSGVPRFGGFSGGGNDLPAGYLSGSMGEVAPVTINFNAPMDRRGAAREIRDLYREGGILNPGLGRVGG
jgi:hypothetical protein